MITPKWTIKEQYLRNFLSIEFLFILKSIINSLQIEKSVVSDNKKTIKIFKDSNLRNVKEERTRENRKGIFKYLNTGFILPFSQGKKGAKVISKISISTFGKLTKS